jgi:hypothetical protein
MGTGRGFGPLFYRVTAADTEQGMRTGLLMLLALGLWACAGSPAGGDADRRAAREEAKRELERECRLAAMQGRRDARCPDPERQPRRTEPEDDRLEVPPPPPVTLPRAN